MLRQRRKAQGQDIMIHTCESGRFVIWAAFTPIPCVCGGGGVWGGAEEVAREKAREKRRKASCNVTHTSEVSCCLSESLGSLFNQ